MDCHAVAGRSRFEQLVSSYCMMLAAHLGALVEVASAKKQIEGSIMGSSLCLRVLTGEHSGEDKLYWYVINLSDDRMSFLHSCNKDDEKRMVKEMVKESKRRVIKEKKMDLLVGKKFRGEQIGEEEEEEDDPTPTITPVCEVEDIPTDCAWIVVGSVVYCFGGGVDGVDQYSRKVQFWDLSDLSKGKNKATPMITSRMHCKAVTLDENIYVFGGTKLSFRGSKPWGEVYEIRNNCWKPLNQPPVFLPSKDLFALPMQLDNEILVGSPCQGCLFSYNVCHDCWYILDEEFDVKCLSYSDPVLVGRILYWVGDELIQAYDLDNKMYFFERIHFWPIKETIRRLRCLRDNRLPFLHMYGDMFCLIWDESEYHDGCCISVLVCHKLSISMRIKRGEEHYSLSVKPLSIEYFLPYGKLVHSFDGLMLL